MNYLGRFIWIASFTLSLGLCAHAARPKVGDEPPLLEATDLLQSPAGAKMAAESLRGQVVVLEFWATWCGPCVAAIPHLNELADKFSGQPVQFIAITAEDRATIEKFLEKRPIKAWIALDTNNAMNKAYGITGIPHTVILGRDGKIAAITYPLTVTEQHITDLLAGRKISLPGDGGGDTVPARKEKEAPPLFQVLIRPSTYTNSQGSSWGGGRMSATGYTVKDVLPMIFDTQADRIVTNVALPSARFDFTVVQQDDSLVNPEKLLQEAVKTTFGLTARWETNKMDALILKVVKTNAPGLTESPTRNMSWRSGLGSMGGIGVSAGSIASFLENQLKMPVVDETGLASDYGYDVSLKWDEKSPDTPNTDGLKKAIQEQLGLKLVSARRPIKRLVIAPAEKQDH